MPKMPYNLSLLVLLLPAIASANSTIVDQHHANVSTMLHQWSNSLDDWLGEPDPSKPASANLRLMLDSQWNRYDGYKIKPRVRAKIKLPALKKRLSLVIGDEDLDNQSRDKNQTSPTYRSPIEKEKRYDRHQTRQDNASIALRWSDEIKRFGIETDFDVGVRSGADVFARFKASKTWQHSDQFSTRFEQIYRYGSNSKHYLRTNLENKWLEAADRFINNHTFLEYTHDLDEDTRWGNSLYRQHDFSGYKRLNYGIFVGGEVDSKKFDLTHYGPFITYRQPIWREWLFVQPEVYFYNNKKLDRKHHLGGFLRLEAIF